MLRRHTRNKKKYFIIIIIRICKEKTKWNTLHSFKMCLLEKKNKTKFEGKLNVVKIYSVFVSHKRGRRKKITSIAWLIL